MIDLDKYMDEGIRIKLFGKEVTLKQLTAKLATDIGELESDITEGNAYQNRAKITLKILNNNAEKVTFKLEDIEKIPVKLQTSISNEVFKYIYKLENDPN